MGDNHFYHITPKGRIETLPSIQAALSSLRHGGYIWLDFFQASREELSELIEPLGIHPLSVEDCIDEEQIPKIEDFPTNTFMVFNAFTYINRELFIDELDFALGKNFIISVSRDIRGGERFFNKLFDKVSLELANITKGPDQLLQVILDYTIDKKFIAVDAIQDRLDEAEEIIVSDSLTFEPDELMSLRRQLLSLRKSLFHERENLIKICRKDSRFIKENTIYHFRDIYDHLARFFEVTEMHRETISNLMEIYLSMINNRMALIANKTNLIMRRLTLINTIFMPLTLLASIGGMSEWTMMTGPHNWKFAYPAFMLLMIIIGFINYFLLRMLESRDSKKSDIKTMKTEIKKMETDEA